MGGCEAAPDDAGVVTRETVLNLAERSIGTADGAGAALFSDIRSVVPLGESLLVMDASPPFLRLFRGDSATLEAGQEGRGPGEMRRPYAAERVGDELIVVDGSELDRLAPDSLTLLGSLGTSPPNGASYTKACGDRLVQIYEGRLPSEPGVHRGNYGIRILSDSGWIDPTGLLPQVSPLTLGGPGLRAASLGDGVAFFNIYKGRLERLLCDGTTEVLAEVDLPPEWEIPHRPRGLAVMDGQVWVFVASRLQKYDFGTAVARWAPGQDRVPSRLVDADFRLFAAGEDGLWIVDNELYPQVVAIPPDSLIAALGLEDRR